MEDELEVDLREVVACEWLAMGLDEELEDEEAVVCIWLEIELRAEEMDGETEDDAVRAGPTELEVVVVMAPLLSVRPCDLDPFEPSERTKTAVAAPTMSATITTTTAALPTADRLHRFTA